MKKHLKYICLFVFTCPLVNILNAIDNEFSPINTMTAKLKGQRYMKQAKQLAAQAGATVAALSEDFSGNQVQVKLLSTKWKKEYERLKALQAANSSGDSSTILRTPSVSRSPSSNNFSEMNSPSVRAELFPPTPSKAQLETMEIEQLRDAAISMQERIEELQKASSDSTSTSGHDTTTAISVPSTQDRELNRVFNGNRTMVEAYKAAVANGNLDGFWPVVKTEVIQKLTECINKIQPGGDNSVLLVQYASGIMYYAGSITKSVTKEEFLRNLALRIGALDFSKITLPADSESSLTQFKSEYVQEISKAVNSLVNELIEGNDSAIILPQELEYNMQVMTRIVTNIRTKGVFKKALTVKGIKEKL